MRQTGLKVVARYIPIVFLLTMGGVALSNLPSRAEVPEINSRSSMQSFIDFFDLTKLQCNQRPKLKLNLKSDRKFQKYKIFRTSTVYCGDTVYGLVSVPTTNIAKGVILLLHSTNPYGANEVFGINGNKNENLAELFRANYIVAAPHIFLADKLENPVLDYKTTEWYAKNISISATTKMLNDHIAFLDAVRDKWPIETALCSVVIGHSLGGHNSLFLGFTYPVMNAIISVDGIASNKTDKNPERWFRVNEFQYTRASKQYLIGEWEWDAPIKFLVSAGVKTYIMQSEGDDVWSNYEKPSILREQVMKQVNFNKTLQWIIYKKNHDLTNQVKRDIWKGVDSTCATP